MSAVLVLVETDAGGATEVSRETLTFVRGLGLDVHALTGSSTDPLRSMSSGLSVATPRQLS